MNAVVSSMSPPCRDPAVGACTRTVGSDAEVIQVFSPKIMASNTCSGVLIFSSPIVSSWRAEALLELEAVEPQTKTCSKDSSYSWQHGQVGEVA